MNTLKVIWLTIVQLARQLLLLPRTMLDAFKQRQDQPPGPKELEAERLDRIRNPSKYRCK